jgi:ATP synthase I chain
MSPTELTSRVTFETGCVVAVLTLLAGWAGGFAAAAGVCAGGTMAIVNFRSLSRRFVGLLGNADGAVVGWAFGFGLRFAALSVATAILVASEWAHPLGVVVGFTLLPCTLIRCGLAASRQG